MTYEEGFSVLARLLAFFMQALSLAFD